MAMPRGWRQGGQPVWIFDLDNTLHNASPHIFPHINRAMTAYIQRHLALDEAAAQALRQDYWHRYGATLLGLIRHHDIDPHHFLRETHDLEVLLPGIVFQRGVKAMLQRLPGRKIVFSNGPQHYTDAVLEATGIADCFAAAYSVERVRFRPKPESHGFRHLFRAEGLNPHRCIMVEDSLPNLATAKRLGLKTVWVSTDSAARLRQPAYVDVTLRNILDLPRALRQL